MRSEQLVDRYPRGILTVGGKNFGGEVPVRRAGCRRNRGQVALILHVRSAVDVGGVRLVERVGIGLDLRIRRVRILQGRRRLAERGDTRGGQRPDAIHHRTVGVEVFEVLVVLRQRRLCHRRDTAAVELEGSPAERAVVEQAGELSVIRARQRALGVAEDAAVGQDEGAVLQRTAGAEQRERNRRCGVERRGCLQRLVLGNGVALDGLRVALILAVGVALDGRRVGLVLGASIGLDGLRVALILAVGIGLDGLHVALVLRVGVSLDLRG